MTYQFKALLAAAAFVAVGTFGAGAATTVSATAYAGEPGYGTDTGSGAFVAGYEASIVSGSVTNEYASPFGDDSEYYTVGSPGLAGSPAALDLGSASDEFSLLWGTVDTYNAIGLFSDPFTLVGWVSGDEVLDILGVAPGGTGAIVDIGSDIDFQYVVFYSNFTGSYDAYGDPIMSDWDTPAFEFALATPAPVPVPAAGLLLVGALGGLAALRRRKSA